MRADKQHYLKKERLRAAFQAIDLDGSGTIDAAELKHLVGAEQDLTQVLAEIGKGVDDVITLEEFEAILVKKSVMSNLRRPPRAGAQRKAGRCLAVPRQLAAVQIVALAAPMVSKPASYWGRARYRRHRIRLWCLHTDEEHSRRFVYWVHSHRLAD